MKMQKLNASLQSFVPQCKSVINLTVILLVSWIAIKFSFGFWTAALYFAYWAVSTSFRPRETRLERVKTFALSSISASLLYLSAKFIFFYANALTPYVPLIILCGLFAALFSCFKIYGSYFHTEKVEMREILEKSSKPILFLHQQ